MKDYSQFIQSKRHLGGFHGFEPTFMPDSLFDYQKHLVEWNVRKGRSADFADCGLGKTRIQITWAQNVVEKTNKRVLVLTPLAVGHQTIQEAATIGVDATRSPDGKLGADKIIVANYERLHYFNPDDFVGVVCDESGCLKSADSVTKAQVNEFMRMMPYRLLCTATAAPNDYIELGNSSEVLGDLGFFDMISKFFKKSEKTLSKKDELRGGLYRFRGHAERDFWRWVCSWARAVRKPSDLGFSDFGFDLPELITRQHVVEARTPNPEWLFDLPAVGLQEQRAERRGTIKERCEMAAGIANSSKDQSVLWCHLNDEGDLLEKLVDGAVQTSGNDSDEKKEELFRAFETGQARHMVSKASVAGYGLNWQHCHRQTHFPSHSFEQWYQAIRRSWRFGQTKPVEIDMITSEGESSVLANLMRKSAAAERMFQNLVDLMNHELRIEQTDRFQTPIQLPSW